jgi:myo-inositol 2-dehydrogenase/D-chiro-inositol 1-dehydrogenase
MENSMQKKADNPESISTQSESENLERRTFLGTVALTGVATLAACTRDQSNDVTSTTTLIEPGPSTAVEGKPIKAGLVGCGSRGTGAALNFLGAGPDLSLVALADVFEDKLVSCRQRLKENGNHELSDDKCFVGFDAYKQLLDLDEIDLVILATPPHFRPDHFEATISARKHVFVEKPLGVDPVGVKSILHTAERADALDLCVVTGTQRRHQRQYIETYNQIVKGAIGEIVAARCYWNTGQLWYKEKNPEWSDMEYMLRDWVNWQWLSGDHIVEQHIHNIDVINWFTGAHPVKALGMGGRMRRVTGDQFDFFDVDFEFDNSRHLHSMCRQIDGCDGNVSEFVVGTQGSSNCSDSIYDLEGNVIWTYKGPNPAGDNDRYHGDNSPYLQEHIDLVTAIRSGTHINEAHQTAISTMVSIMGRISAYSGKEVSWEELMQSDLRLGPETYALGRVAIPISVPVAGQLETS